MTKKSSSLNITIFGIGAMGSLFGSRLHTHAHVTLFGHWPEQIETLRRDGLTVTHPDGHQSQHHLNITDNLDEVPPTDIALVLVKSHQTAQTAQQVAQVLRPDGVVVTLQNGLGNVEKLIEAVGKKRTALGITAQGATMTAPGQLRHAGFGLTYLALTPHRKKRLQELAQLFNQNGLETTLVDNPDSLVWGKLAINAGINPLTALLELPNGALAEDESLYRVMAAAANEVAKVASALGVCLPFADAASRTAEVCRNTATNRSSMLQDIKRAAPTEIDAICGSVVHFGQRLGVPTPVNERLLHLVHDKEAGRFQRLSLAAMG